MLICLHATDFQYALIKDIVETLTWDAATLSRLRVDSFEYLRLPVETGIESSFSSPPGGFIVDPHPH